MNVGAITASAGLGSSYALSTPDTSGAAGASLDINGDKVTISDAAKTRGQALSKSKQEASSSSSSDQSSSAQALQAVQKQIEKLKEQISQVEKGDLPTKEKNQRVLLLNQQMLLLQQELSKLEAANGSQSHGGTQAKGFADSLTQQGQSS